MRACEVRPLRLVTYENGMLMQEALVEMRQREEIPDQLLLIEHPPVITLGRGGKEDNLLATPELLRASGVRFYETTRGGDITYHGPGQIVGYPIVHLGDGRRDIRKYVDSLEEVLIRTAADYGVTATRWDNNRGIWVGREKLAAIGVRIARWVTSHGFAFNVSTNLSHFGLITPCGIPNAGVTSLRKVTGRDIPIDEVRSTIVRHFGEVFDRDMATPGGDLPIVQVVVTDGERVLLMKRTAKRGSYWQPITGRIESGENTEQAASRELREETGIDAPVASLGLRQSFLVQPQYIPAGRNAPLFADVHSFVVRVPPGTPVTLSPEEHDELGWFTFEKALETIHWTDDRDAIEEVRQKLARVL